MKHELDGGGIPRNRGASLASSIAHIVDVCSLHPGLAIIAALLIAVLAIAYVTGHFAIDTDTAKLIAEDVPWRQRELAFDEAFSHRADLIAVVVDAATPELAESATARLAQRISEQRTLFRNVWRPDGGPFFDRNGLLFQSTDELKRTTQRMIEAQPLLGALANDPSLRGLMDALSLAVEGAGKDPAKANALLPSLVVLADAFDTVAAGATPAFSWRALIDGRNPDALELRRFILAQPVLDYRVLRPGERATDAIREAARSLTGEDTHIRVRLTGPVPMADEELETLAEGAAQNAIAMLAAIVALLWLALRSLSLIAAILVALSLGLAATAAFALLVFGSFNLISIAFAVLFVGLGVDFGIQFCVCYRAQRFRHDDLPLALRAAARAIGGALALAAAATAAGFYSFVPTSYRGVAALGAISGTGMIIAFTATVTLLPALLAVLRPPAERADVGYASLAPLGRALVIRRRSVLLGAVVIAIASAVLLPRLHFDFDPLHLRSPRVESVATLLDLMRDPRTTPYTIDVLAPSLADAVLLAQRAEALPEVDHAITAASFVPDQQSEKLAVIEDAALLLDPVLNPISPRAPPSDDDNVRSMRRMARRLSDAATLNAGHPTAPVFERLGHATFVLANGDARERDRLQNALMPQWIATVEKLRTAMQAEPVTIATLPDVVKRDWLAADGRARVEVFPKGDANDNATLRRFVGAMVAIAPEATGPPVSIVGASDTVIGAFVQAGILAFLSIALLLAITLRRPSDVALALAPLALAGLATLALCVVLGISLNFENIIALPLLLGIGVSFNIYFVMAWRAGSGRLLESSLARAVIFSALTTGIGFGSLWLSHHPGTSSMGELLALSLACTLVTTLLFLPALLGVPRQDSGDKAVASGDLGEF